MRNICKIGLSAWAGIILSWPAATLAVPPDRQLSDFNFAYATFFGTGWYKISEEREAFVIRAAPRWEMSEANLDGEGYREVGYSFRMPFTVGLARLDFDDIPGIVDPDNFSAMSVGLAFDADIPINERLSVRPGAEIGYATVIDQSEYAWTYRLEARARYRFETEAINWALLGNVGIVGDVPSGGSSGNFVFASIAAEFEHGTRWSTREGKPLFFYWHLSYTDYIDEVEIGAGTQALESIGNFWQVGASMGRASDAIRIWRFKLDRLGLGYNYSTNGDLRGITVFFRSLYEL